MIEIRAGTQITGQLIRLDGNRSVFVGQAPGESAVYIKFSNGEDETKLLLSLEASEVLRELLGLVSSRGLMANSKWVLAVGEQGAENWAP